MNVDTLIDFCLGSKGAPFDIAKIVDVLLKNKHRYVGDNNWEYLDNNTNTWKQDTDRNVIYSAIRNIVYQAFMDRSVYWQNCAYTNDISLKIDCQLKCQKLLEICLKLKRDRFIKDVVKEARAFLSVD